MADATALSRPKLRVELNVERAFSSSVVECTTDFQSVGDRRDRRTNVHRTLKWRCMSDTTENQGMASCHTTIYATRQGLVNIYNLIPQLNPKKS